MHGQIIEQVHRCLKLQDEIVHKNWYGTPSLGKISSARSISRFGRPTQLCGCGLVSILYPDSPHFWCVGPSPPSSCLSFREVRI